MENLSVQGIFFVTPFVTSMEIVSDKTMQKAYCEVHTP